MRDPRQLDWNAALFFMTDVPAWSEKIFRGGLYIALFPPIGWPMALGYRSIVGSRLVEGSSPILPEWNQRHGEIFLRGMGAVCVILAYLSPFFAAYWLLGMNGPIDLKYSILFFVACVVYPPLFVPTVPLVYAWAFPWLEFSVPEIAFLTILFFMTVYLLPSAFVQVALRGTYFGAFRLLDVIRFVCRNPSIYIEAWILSLLVSAVAVLSGILLPWGLVWSYLVILYAFNEASVLSNNPEVLQRYADSILLKRRGSSG